MLLFMCVRYYYSCKKFDTRREHYLRVTHLHKIFIKHIQIILQKKKQAERLGILLQQNGKNVCQQIINALSNECTALIVYSLDICFSVGAGCCSVSSFYREQFRIDIVMNFTASFSYSFSTLSHLPKQYTVHVFLCLLDTSAKSLLSV